MDDPSPLLFEVEDGVATITINRPAQGNSLTPEMFDAIEAAWARINDDPAIIVAILTGAGDRHFCTGAAVGELKPGQVGLRPEPYRVVHRFTSRMCQVGKPVIGVVNGLANAAGLNLVADCDIVVASAGAAFMDTHVSIGMVSGIEQIAIARRGGIGAALLMSLGGKNYRLPAERAYQLGIVDLLEPDTGAAMARARELATAMCTNSPRAMNLTKRAVWAATEMPDPAAATFGWELAKSQWSHPDFEEGPKAFTEKRKPVWNPDPAARS